MQRNIRASVGAMGGVNLIEDVRTVQELLNGVPPGQGGPAPPLVVDGVCGPKTINAIQKFQLHHFGWSGADGRVDPGGPTIQKLNELNQSSAHNTYVCTLYSPCPPDAQIHSLMSGLYDQQNNTSEFQPVQFQSSVAPATDEEIMRKAFEDSRITQGLARNALNNLLLGINNESNQPLNGFQQRVLISVGRWLKVRTDKNPTDRQRVREVVLQAIQLINRNLAVKTKNNSAPQFRRINKNVHAQVTGNPDDGVECGEPFFTVDGPNCRRDVITHEFFHFVGVNHGGGAAQAPTPRASILTPEQALDSADNLAQLVSEIMNGRTDACARAGD